MAVDSDGGVGSTCRVLLDSRGAQGRAVLVTPVLPWWHPGPSTWGAAPASPPGAPIPHAGRWPRGHRVPAMPLAAVPGEAGGAVLWLGATRVRGLRRRRCLPSQRACAWPSGRRDCAALAAWGGLARGGAELSPPSPPRWTVCLSLRPLGWTGHSGRCAFASLWCGVTGRGLVNQWHFFVPWVMDEPRMRQKDEAAGAKQRAWLCWGLSSARGHRAVTTSRTPRIALLLTTGTTSVGS